MQLINKVAIVTGADSGIGRAIAELFAREGADVCVTYHTDADGAEATARAVREAGRRAHVVQGDVGDTAAVANIFAQSEKALGVPDILVNNAGKAMSGVKVADMDDALMERVLRTNLVGPLFCARLFIRARLAVGGGGRIVNISSVAQHLPTAESAPYGMSKAGLGSLARSLSVELAEHRINVNNVAPGLIETPMTADRTEHPEKLEKSLKEIPWGRVGQPEEIAKLALFLAADTGDYVTGQTWTMDGGLTMNWGGA